MKKHIFLSTLIFIAISVIASSCASTRFENKKHTYMNNVYESLRTDLTPNEAEVSIIEDSVKVIFKNGILFNIGEANLLSSIYPAFQRFAKVLNTYPNTNILITGHTDSSGNSAINKKLSESRAENAKWRLAIYDVLVERMATWGQGDSAPIAPNDTEEGRQKNRRVEFVILYNIIK